jgi:hypothetical protein
VARLAILAGLAAFALLTEAQTFDQPRPHGSEIAREQAPPPRGPTPPFGGPAAPPARGCPRETLVRFSAFEAWLRELPLGELLGALAARRLIGSCAPA